MHVEIADVTELGALFGNCLNDVGVSMTQDIGGDAGKHVDVAITFNIEHFRSKTMVKLDCWSSIVVLKSG